MLILTQKKGNLGRRPVDMGHLGHKCWWAANVEEQIPAFQQKTGFKGANTTLPGLHDAAWFQILPGTLTTGVYQ